ncbi:hypothetical protein EV421DRAFT_1718669, partial [Armillaria borealis]
MLSVPIRLRSLLFSISVVTVYACRLEILLDDITTQLYHDNLPLSIVGSTRYSLLDAYREHVGYAYVPPALDPALRWSDAIPFDMTDATDIREWPKIFTPMKPAEKWNGRASDTFDLKHNTSDKRFLASGTPTGDVPSTAVISASRPAGCKWSNNSCPFDSTLFVLYNLWRIDPAAWTVAFNSFGNQWLDILAESFNKHIEKLYTL